MNSLFNPAIHAPAPAGGNVKALLLIFSCLWMTGLQAQTDSKKETNGKLSPRISLSSLQVNDDSIMLTTEVKTKQGGFFQAVEFERIRFYDRNGSLDKPIGAVLTDDRGIATLSVGMDELVKGEDGTWALGATFTGNEEVGAGESEISFLQGGIILSGEKEDTVLTLKLRLFAPNNNNQPIPDTEVVFYVKRYFSDLKIGEGVTDENGEVAIDCPRDLPGDSQGNIILVGKAEDLEEYGSVSATIARSWGIPEAIPDVRKTRALWSHSPPLWMVITFSLLMSVVWGHYIVIIYRLFRLRKQAP